MKLLVETKKGQYLTIETKVREVTSIIWRYSKSLKKKDSHCEDPAFGVHI